MAHSFEEGVKPGGLVSSTDTGILLCYLLSHASSALSRQQIEEILLGNDLVNYFTMAECLAELEAQNCVKQDKELYSITENGKNIVRNLAQNLPASVKETAINSVIFEQTYVDEQAKNMVWVEQKDNGYTVHCNIKDHIDSIFTLDLYMPDEMSATVLKNKFEKNGTVLYKLILSACTGDKASAIKALQDFGN